MYVEDLARASIHIMNLDKKYQDNTSPMCSHINVKGEDLTIKKLAEIIKDVVNYKGDILFDLVNDGVPKNC